MKKRRRRMKMMRTISILMIMKVTRKREVIWTLI
jgi:hypothetical protein